MFYSLRSAIIVLTIASCISIKADPPTTHPDTYDKSTLDTAMQKLLDKQSAVERPEITISKLEAENKRLAKELADTKAQLVESTRFSAKLGSTLFSLSRELASDFAKDIRDKDTVKTLSKLGVLAGICTGDWKIDRKNTIVVKHEIWIGLSRLEQTSLISWIAEFADWQPSVVFVLNEHGRMIAKSINGEITRD